MDKVPTVLELGLYNLNLTKKKATVACGDMSFRPAQWDEMVSHFVQEN